MKLLHAFAAAALATITLEAHAIGRLADIAIVDRTTHRELPVYWHEGRAYVVGKPGNEYRIVVRNRSRGDLLAVVSVDGVNAMSGETADPSQSGYVLPAWGRAEVSGWRKSLDETAAFYFTTLGDSYAARTDRPANVGVIGVALFERKEAPPPMAAAPLSNQALKSRSADALRASGESPPAEAREQAPASAAPLGTGHGRREESHIHWVRFDRASDTPAETIAIYYDSYRNLVARGILRAPLAPRDPAPFPSTFVPDPC